MVTVTLTIECELHADPGSDEVTDAWAWSVERQLEDLALVKTASVIDFKLEKR